VRRILSTLLVLAAGTIIPAASTLAVPAQAAAPVAGSIGIRLLDAPAAARSDWRARVYIVDFLPLGSVIHRHIEVTNGSASARRIVLYSGAASISHGTFNVAPGRTPNDLTTWITLRPAVLNLAAGASARVTATIAVPRNASPGERYAGIWAQTSTAQAQHRQNVLEVSRVGIRVYLAVGKGGPPAANFTITSLTARRQPGGQPAVTAQVRNTGGRAVDLSGDLTLAHGPGGLSAGPFAARLGTTVAPGQNEPVTIPLSKHVPDGPWTAHIHLASGLTSRTAQATITFPSGVGAAPSQATLDANGRYLTGAIIAGLVLLAALVFASVRRSRRSVPTRAPAGGRHKPSRRGT
jgi:hypothetical protein